MGSRPFSYVSFGNKEAKRLYDSITVCGRSPNGIEDWKHVLRYFQYRSDLVSVVTRWNILTQDFELPEVSTETSFADRWIVDIHRAFTSVLQVITRYHEHVAADLNRLFYRDAATSQVPYSIAVLDRFLVTVDNWLLRRRLLTAQCLIDQILEKLTPYSGEVVDLIVDFVGYR